MSVFTDIYFDPENECIVLRSIDETGAVIGGLPQARIALTDLEFDDNQEALFRRIHFTDSLDGSKKRCSVLATKPADDATDDGHSSSTEDLYFGGGGGLTAYLLSDVGNNYVTGKPCDGEGAAIAGTTAVDIAMPTELREENRPTTDGGNYAVWPPYKAGSIIQVASTTHTQVFIDEVELLLIDVNVDARAVARELHWKDANAECAEFKAWVVMSWQVAAADAMPS